MSWRAVPDHGTSKTIIIATWNIQGRLNGGLEAEWRALWSVGVDIAILQERNLTRRIYTRLMAGYQFAAINVPSYPQGGLQFV